MVRARSGCSLEGMRLTEFDRLMEDEFGATEGKWLAHSHHIAALGGTPDELLEGGHSPKKVWEALCDELDIPEERRLGVDRPGF